MENILLLRRVPLFASLRLAEIRRFSERMEVRHFKEGDIICEEGKPGGQALYVVASGQLNIILEGKILTTLSTTNYFGEVSLLSGGLHSATIKAVTAGKLLVIKKDLFDEIVKKHPEVLRWLSQILGKKLRQTIKFTHAESDEQRVFSMLSNEAGVGKSVLAANLAASFLKQTGKRTVLVDFYYSPGSCASLLKITPHFTVSGFLKKGKRIALSNIQRCVIKHSSGLEVLVFHKKGESIHLDRNKLARFFSMLKKAYEVIVVDVPSGLNSLQVKAFMQESEGIIFLVKENPLAVPSWERFLNSCRPEIPSLDSKLWTGVLLEGNKPQARLPLLCRFVLPFDKKAVKAFVANGNPFVNTFLHSALSRAIHAFVREIAHIKVGVALSAGMASGLAHIGVLKVLQRENIPIDVVAGTSGGALYGAPYVAGVPLAEVEKSALKIGKLKALSLLDFTLPYAGFIRGEKIVDLVKSFIGNLKFEELEKSFKVIATDFYTGEVFVIEKGLILEALRATISVPGIFTPYKYEDRFLVDGATISPLPVDILYRSGAEKVIAVNTCLEPLVGYNNKGKEKRARSKFPPHFFDVITHTRAITSQHMAEIESHKAGVTISPDTSNFKWRDYHRAGGIIEAGEKAAEEALPRIRNILRLDV